MKLDIGCGHDKQLDHFGVDIHKTPCVDLLASAEALPFTDNSIQHIYSRRCIQYVSNDQKAFNEIHRVLHPLGTTIIIVASWRGWLYYQIKWLLRQKPYQIFHRYHQQNIPNKLQEAGFPYTYATKLRNKNHGGYDIMIMSTKGFVRKIELLKKRRW